MNSYDPSWTSIFSKIKGVVADSGSMLSHAAICTREYNIPAVVGTSLAITFDNENDIHNIMMRGEPLTEFDWGVFL